VPHGGRVEGLERLVADRGEQLLRTAVLLAGSREAGEDLLQEALLRLLRHWPRVAGDPEGYLRRTLYNLAVDGWRRQRAGRQRLRMLRAAAVPDGADSTAVVDLRDALVRLLVQLPPRQRSLIVLRYWEQLSEAEVAEVLGCSIGAVKSGTSRGLARLRELSGSWPHAQTGPRAGPPAAEMGPAKEEWS
jgi:RNA polymerase sigma-70 factor (sigma-E family)